MSPFHGRPPRMSCAAVCLSDEGKASMATRPMAPDRAWKLTAAHIPQSIASVLYPLLREDLGDLELLIWKLVPHDAVTYALLRCPTSINQVLCISPVSFTCSPQDLA
eukprot:2191899-Pyramimonas_sp.AAC.1